MKKNFTLYLDESGSNILYPVEEWDNNPALETHCTLLGCILPNNQLPELKKQMNTIKMEIFNSKDVIFHSVDIRNKRGMFVLFGYLENMYEKFKNDMNSLTQDLSPVIICSSLNKKLWVEKNPAKYTFKDDPYEQAFIYLLERYTHFLNNQGDLEGGQGVIVAESRGVTVNKSLQETYSHIIRYGTQFHPYDFFKSLAPKIEFRPKSFNIPGLQLSDYFAYPFYINHKFPTRENVHYKFLEAYVYPGDFWRYGHKKWPV